jgi:hypothetical protein
VNVLDRLLERIPADKFWKQGHAFFQSPLNLHGGPPAPAAEFPVPEIVAKPHDALFVQRFFLQLQNQGLERIRQPVNDTLHMAVVIPEFGLGFHLCEKLPELLLFLSHDAPLSVSYSC